eukprot:2802540-Pyramimonas_sp.AAC.1
MDVRAMASGGGGLQRRPPGSPRGPPKLRARAVSPLPRPASAPRCGCPSSAATRPASRTGPSRTSS